MHAVGDRTDALGLRSRKRSAHDVASLFSTAERDAGLVTLGKGAHYPHDSLADWLQLVIACRFHPSHLALRAKLRSRFSFPWRFYFLTGFLRFDTFKQC